ncbi:MAG: NifB/NifX family molybdenum-iron cluster-binding protein [Clostridiaceae bacterium]|nr:NifB/NifX family molybdenum-iron cluster-binding protein [Clostridiaceae bacterium]
MKVCFPVKSNEGLKSVPYGHFGSAPLFVIYNLETKEVMPINNGDLNHEHGKCQPIKALCNADVDAVIVGGIGQGAIMKLNSMGVKVYEAIEGTLEENISAYKDNKLVEFASNHVCHHDHCEGHK